MNEFNSYQYLIQHTVKEYKHLNEIKPKNLPLIHMW